MLLFVIILNLILTFINFFLVVKIWKFYCFLKNVTYQLTYIEKQLDEIFSVAPHLIFKGQQGTSQLRKNYQKLLIQLKISQNVFRSLKFLRNLLYR